MFVASLAIFAAIADTRAMVETGLRARLVSLVAAIVGMIGLPALCFALQSVGPGARVVFFDYLPLEELAIAGAAGALGASLGPPVARGLRLLPPTAAGRRWPRLRSIGLGLLLGWIALPHLRAFPASGSLAERDAWARAHVRHYAALTRVIAAVPELQRDVGRIVAIAPTGSDEQRFAREMNGDDMLFVLDVVGERGRGVFHANCTLDDDRVYSWNPGRWLSQGREQRIDKVPDRVPRPP